MWCTAAQPSRLLIPGPTPTHTDRGSLLIRSLNGLVDPRHCVRDSEYMVTLMVVVQKAAFRTWEKTYERLNDYVVPRSSELITEDAEYGLFSVTVFRKMADDFKAAAREQKYIVRDFELDEAGEAAGELEVAALKSDISKKFVSRLQEPLPAPAPRAPMMMCLPVLYCPALCCCVLCCCVLCLWGRLCCAVL